MRHAARVLRAIPTAAFLLLLPLAPSPGRAQAEAPHAPPQYQVDPFWPKPLPNRWTSAKRPASPRMGATTSGSSTVRAP
jgi:hypothetical protein